MKSTILFIAFVFCSAGSSPQKAAEELMARYAKAFETKNKTLLDDVITEPFIQSMCNTTISYSHEQVFNFILATNITNFEHEVGNATMNGEKNVMWFNVDWKAIGRKYDVEAVLDNGTWRMKHKYMECPSYILNRTD